MAGHVHAHASRQDKRQKLSGFKNYRTKMVGWNKNLIRIHGKAKWRADKSNRCIRNCGLPKDGRGKWGCATRMEASKINGTLFVESRVDLVARNAQDRRRFSAFTAGPTSRVHPCPTTQIFSTWSSDESWDVKTGTLSRLPVPLPSSNTFHLDISHSLVTIFGPKPKFRRMISSIDPWIHSDNWTMAPVSSTWCTSKSALRRTTGSTSTSARPRLSGQKLSKSSPSTKADATVDSISLVAQLVIPDAKLVERL